MSPKFFGTCFPNHPDALGDFMNQVRQSVRAEGRLLDLGCGEHQSLGFLRTADFEIWGCDFHEHPKLRDREWFRLMDARGAIPFPDAHFDLVTAVWVLEHVTAPGDFLSEVDRVLRPGGIFIGLSINSQHYVVWIRRLIGLLPHAWNQWLVRRLYGRPEHDTFPACYRLNSQRRFNQALGSTDLALVRFERIANPGYFSFWRWLEHVAVLADWFLDRISPRWGRIYFVATLKKQGSDSEPTSRAA